MTLWDLPTHLSTPCLIAECILHEGLVFSGFFLLIKQYKKVVLGFTLVLVILRILGD